MLRQQRTERSLPQDTGFLAQFSFANPLFAPKEKVRLFNAAIALAHTSHHCNTLAAVRELAGMEPNARFKGVLEQIALSLQSGCPFADALKPFSPAFFERFYVGAIQTGENHGSYEVVLPLLSKYLDRCAANRAPKWSFVKNEQALWADRFSVLLRSGAGELEALNILAGCSKGKLKGISRDLKRAVSEGEMLHESMQPFASYFSKEFIGLVKLGERHGVLVEALEELSSRKS